MKFQSLAVGTLERAIRLYQDIAYGNGSRKRWGPDPDALNGDLNEVLGLFEKEMCEPVPGYPCVRYSLRLGNCSYPYMKLVLQEHLIAGEFFFAVNTHDQMEVQSDSPDYESWTGLCRFNRELKLQIESAFAAAGLDTAACLRDAVQRRGPMSNAGQTRGTVLIVDDEEDLADTVELLLRRRGFRVFKIHDGRIALESARELLPDLILLDYELPGLDGLQVVEQLRADETLREIPVLLASAAKVSIEDIQRTDGFLAKPFQEGLLYAMVDRVLQSRESGS